MCRTAHAVLSTAICGIQMLVRVFMTTILMLENVIRMCLQTLYNFISFMLQLLSLVPICCVFLVTSRMKCFMCGGGGPCPVSRGGACDCLMSLFAIIILFFIFRATGVLDKIFYSIGYAKATTHIVRFVPTTGSITECSRNDTDTEYVFYPLDTTAPILRYFYVDYTETPNITTFSVDTESITGNVTLTESTTVLTTTETTTEGTTLPPKVRLRAEKDENKTLIKDKQMAENSNDKDPPNTDLKYDSTVPDLSNRGKIFDWTTMLYYLA